MFFRYYSFDEEDECKSHNIYKYLFSRIFFHSHSFYMLFRHYIKQYID